MRTRRGVYSSRVVVLGTETFTGFTLGNVNGVGWRLTVIVDLNVSVNVLRASGCRSENGKLVREIPES